MPPTPRAVSAAAHHELPANVATVHWGYFDAALEPVLSIESGDTVTIQTVSGAPEYMPDPPLVVPAELRQIHSTLQPELGPHILTGPVAIEGAEPGDRPRYRLGLEHAQAGNRGAVRRCRSLDAASGDRSGADEGHAAVGR